MIETSVIANVGVSTCSVPALSGATRFFAGRPATISGTSSAGKRPSASTIAAVVFHHTVLSPSPSKPEPLFANADAYS